MGQMKIGRVPDHSIGCAECTLLTFNEIDTHLSVLKTQPAQRISTSQGGLGGLAARKALPDRPL